MLDTPQRSSWEDMSIETRSSVVKNRLENNGTYSSIGAEFGISRSTISSHVYRYRKAMGLPEARKPDAPRGSKRVPVPKGPKRFKRRRVRAPIYQIMPNDAERAEPDMIWQRPEVWAPIEGTEPVTLLELSSKGCRWPIGEKPILYCGQTRREQDQSYCPHHCRLAYPKIAA